MDADRNNQSREDRDRVGLLNILDEDIWHLVANCGTDTMESMSNMSLYFRRLFLERRTTFLFPKVWKILCNDWMNVRSHRHARIDPFFWGSLSNAEYAQLPNIRLVCKTWCDAFDNCYRFPIPRHNIIRDYQFHIFAIRNQFTCKFDNFQERYNSPRSAIKFLEHFYSTHGGVNQNRSPFVGNALHIRYTGSDENKDDRHFYYDGIAEIILRYGQHVRHLSLAEAVTSFELEGYKKLSTILHGTPHLESLKIHHTLIRVGFLPPRTYHPVLERDKLLNLIRYIELNPLPTLKSLQSVKISGNGSFVGILYELLVRNNHISQLVINNLSIAEYNLLRIPLGNLRELSLTIYCKYDLDALEDGRLNWPLTKLAVGIAMHFHSVYWSKLFSVVENKWSETLTDFLLTIPLCAPNTASPTVGDFPDRLYLKRVKRLRIKFHTYCSLDFLLPLKDTLEYLCVVDKFEGVNYVAMERFGKIVELHGKVKFWSCARRPTKSDIWKYFPKLDRVQYIKDNNRYCLFSRKMKV